MSLAASSAAAHAGRPLKAVVGEFASAQFSRFKGALTELAVATLGPVGSEMKRLLDDPAEIDRVLADGGERARAIATPILAEVYEAVGFLRP